MHDLESLAALPSVQDLGRLVGRVIDDHDLVLLVLERGAALEQPLDHPLLVVRRDVDGHERLVANVDVSVAIAVAMSIAVAAPQESHQTVEMARPLQNNCRARDQRLLRVGVQ